MSRIDIARLAERRRAFEALMEQRIVVLDGAMGTMVQNENLDEAGFRGERFEGHGHDLRGDADALNLSQPDVIRGIHDGFLNAGADVIQTNTFNSTRIAQADYGLEEMVAEINREGARVAREAADAAEAKDGEPRFVVGSMGPTNRTASISPDVENPGYRNTSFDELCEAYGEAARGLLEGGADMLLIETVFDTLNAKAAIFAILELGDELGGEIPVMVSGTITDLSGRNLSGQTVEAFWNSVRHAHPVTIGLNCAFGADQLRPHLAQLARVADAPVCCYPNAGLPNEMGEYDERPETTARLIGQWAAEGLVNAVGGCCGTTPEHIAAIRDAVAPYPPRAVPETRPAMRLSGLEPFNVSA